MLKISYKIFTMEIGQRIKKAIEESKLTPDQVAAHAEMSTTNLYKIYKRDSIESRYLVKIAEILNQPVGYFLYDRLDEDRATYTTAQTGIGNQAGTNNKQKIIPPGGQNAVMASSEVNIDKVLHELELCKTENAGLQKEKANLEEKLQLKDEIIDLLKKKI